MAYSNRFDKFGDSQRRAKFPHTSLPDAVQRQRQLREKYQYEYRRMPNGNIENNSTLFVKTGVAHYHQITEVFAKAVTEAKNREDIFGPNFECDVSVNLLRKKEGQYVGSAYVDLTNPALYYVLLGMNADGTERAWYEVDPSWQPPSISESSSDWADDVAIEPPRIRHELPALLLLSSYEYDEKQREHLMTTDTHGKITISPAFMPAFDNDCNPFVLFVQEVPSEDVKFLYEIFSRYARTRASDESDYSFYPRINIKPTRAGKLVATVKYAHQNDAGFAMAMLKKIRALFNGQEIVMPVRNARLLPGH